jgi:STAM-binding protein
VTAHRAKRENGGLGEDPPGSTMTYKLRENSCACGSYPANNCSEKGFTIASETNLYGVTMERKERPRTVSELVAEGNDYDFIPSVSFRSWIHVARSVLRQADVSDHEGESYVYYSRFADLMLNKLPKHPDINVSGNLRQLNAILHAELPRVLDSMESVKMAIERDVESYNFEQAQIKELRALETRKKLEDQRKLRQRQLETVSQPKPVEPVEDNSYLDTLAAFKRLREQPNELPVDTKLDSWSFSYPTIPERSLSLDVLGTSAAEYLASPNLPPKVPNRVAPTDSTRPPPVPEKTTVQIEHKSRYSTEGGVPLKTVFVPKQLREEFLQIAAPNTGRNLETCGILCGKLNRNAFFINHLVIPPQESTSETCSTTNEEVLFEYVDQKELFILGWIHTHPTQSCFLSSIDLHTQNAYQIMLPEAVAIVCAPQHNPSYGIFRLTDPPGVDIIKKCRKASTFHPHGESDLYKNAYNPGHIVVKDNLPFETKDLRDL